MVAVTTTPTTNVTWRETSNWGEKWGGRSVLWVHALAASITRSHPLRTTLPPPPPAPPPPRLPTQFPQHCNHLPCYGHPSYSEKAPTNIFPTTTATDPQAGTAPPLRPKELSCVYTPLAYKPVASLSQFFSPLSPRLSISLSTFHVVSSLSFSSLVFLTLKIAFFP